MTAPGTSPKQGSSKLQPSSINRQGSRGSMASTRPPSGGGTTSLNSILQKQESQQHFFRQNSKSYFGGNESLRHFSISRHSSRENLLVQGGNHELVALSSGEKRDAKQEKIITWTLIVLEGIDVSVDLLNFYYFIHSGAESSSLYGSLYSISTVVVTLLGLYVIYNHVRQIIRIERQISIGLAVQVGRSRQQRTRATAGGRGVRVSPVHPLKRQGSKEARLLEFEVAALRRRADRARFIVITAFVEDACILIFALYRLGYMETLIDKDFTSCLQNTQLPASCLTGDIALVLLQLGGCIFFLAFKLSFLRDYFSLCARTAQLESKMRSEQQEVGSVLDSFAKDQVSEEEINLVVETRKILKNILGSAKTEEYPDLRILFFLRRNGNDVVLTAKAVREWVSSRKGKATQIKRALILQDMAFDDIPGIRELTSVIPYADPAHIDEEHSCLVQYASISSIADFDGLMKLMTPHDITSCFDFIAERNLLLTEHLSKSLRKVLSVVVLCDARGDLSDASVFARVGGKYRKAVKKITSCPIEVKFILWKAGSQIRTAVDMMRGDFTIVFMDTLAGLQAEISMDFIPKELGGNLVFETNETVSVDPWGLKQCTFSPLSKLLGEEQNALRFYSDVTREEAAFVSTFRVFLLEVQAEAMIDLSKRSTAASHRRHSQLLKRPNAATLVEASKVSCMAKMKELLKSGSFSLENVPKSVFSDINLLRFARKSKLRMGEAANDFLMTCLWRSKLELNELNQEIQCLDYSMSDLPLFDEFRNAWPINPIYEVDLENQIIVFYGRSATESKELKTWTHDRLKKALQGLYEYLFIVVDQLSTTHEMLFEVQFLHYLDTFKSFFTGYEHVLAASVELEKHYPLLFKTPQIAVTPKPQFVVNVLAMISSNLGFKEFQRAHMMVISTSGDGRSTLSSYVDLTRLPKFLGGTRDINTLDPVNLRNMTFPLLSETLRVHCRSLPEVVWESDSDCEEDADCSQMNTKSNTSGILFDEEEKEADAAESEKGKRTKRLSLLKMSGLPSLLGRRPSSSINSDSERKKRKSTRISAVERGSDCSELLHCDT